MSSYGVAAVVVVLLSAVLKYLVWDFFNKVQSLDTQYSARIAEAHAAIHDRKFLPIIADLYDAIAARRAVLPSGSAPTGEILTELAVDASVRQAIDVISERIALDRAYGLACKTSLWVAVPWLGSAALFGILFFWHYNEKAGMKSLWILWLLMPMALLVGIGCLTLVLYRLALNKFIRMLGANPL
jgi:hypothetical protein